MQRIVPYKRNVQKTLLMSICKWNCSPFWKNCEFKYHLVKATNLLSSTCSMWHVLYASTVPTETSTERPRQMRRAEFSKPTVCGYWRQISELLRLAPLSRAGLLLSVSMTIYIFSFLDAMRFTFTPRYICLLPHGQGSLHSDRSFSVSPFMYVVINISFVWVALVVVWFLHHALMDTAFVVSTHLRRTQLKLLALNLFYHKDLCFSKSIYFCFKKSVRNAENDRK